MAHVVIDSAGITGVTRANALLKRGHDVTVVDRYPYPAMEASSAKGRSALGAQCRNVERLEHDRERHALAVPLRRDAIFQPDPPLKRKKFV